MKQYFATAIMIGLFSVPSLFGQGNHNDLQLRADPAYFSPNGDGLQDQTFFYPVMKSEIGVAQWTLDIVTAKSHRRVFRMTGKGVPGLIKWDGVNSSEEIAPDDVYLARLKVSGRDGKLSAEQTFTVDTITPQIDLSLSTAVFDRSFLENGRMIFHPFATDNSPIDRWLMQIVDTSGRTVFVHWSSGTVQEVPWDGTDRATGVLVPHGAYRVLFQAWDKAGNESAPVFQDLQVNVTAREMLERALHKIQVNETGMGLIVSLAAVRLFDLKQKKPEFSEEGRSLLTEVSILLNAYPDSLVKLDGYSNINKKVEQDRDRSSIYAWRVYSYLIKEGNVKASRLTVRGRGRSAMFDRRSVGVPLLKNGVEIVLEGQGQW